MKNAENQHILSQVYLKGFGYQDANNQWKISTLDASLIETMEKYNKRWISQKSIESFLSENNIFDLVFTDEIDVKFYENFNSHIENLFLQINNDLDSIKSLSKTSEAALYGMIINLLIRTKLFRNSLNLILKDENRKKVLLDEIFSFLPESELIRKYLKLLPKKSELNFISLLLYERILTGFAEFYYSILETDPNEGWFTSDNPVMIKDFVTINSIFSRNTQIIFPINRKYLVYCFHPNNKIIDYKNLQNKSCTNCDLKMKDKILEDFVNYNHFIGSQYFIFPNEFIWK